MLRKLSLALLASAAILPSTVYAEIGSVAAVNRDLEGTPPAGDKRALQLGNRVVKDELIQTSPLGSGQLMFLDQTTLTVAPGSDIVLDEYVYDANRQTGDMALSLTRGTLRIIGGRITKKSEAIIRTPTATVGIRGGLAIIEVDENGDTKVILIAGEYAKINGPDGQVIYLSRPNAWADVTKSGGIQFAGLVPPELLEQLYRRFEGKGDGGTANAASSAALALVNEYAVQLNNAEEKDGHRRQPVSTSGESPEDDRTEGDNEDDDDSFIDVSFAQPNQPQNNNPPPPPPASNLPGGGAFAAGGTGHVGFSGLASGSIIGLLGDNVVVQMAVPTTTGELQAGFGLGESFSRSSPADGRGFTEFFIDSGGLPDRATDEVLALDQILPILDNDVRDLFIVGYSDLDQDFHLFQFDANFVDTAIPSEQGQFFFGTASPNQAVLGPDLGQGDTSANTKGTYTIQPNLNGFAPDLPGSELLIIANGGESRFQGTGVFDPTSLLSIEGPKGPPRGENTGGAFIDIGSIGGEPVFGGPGAIAAVNVSLDLLEANGGQVLSGVMENNSSGTSTGSTGFDSLFEVFAEPIAENGPGGLSFGGRSFGTFFDGESFGYRFVGHGTLEDGEGNTVFGTGDDYIITSSFLREDGEPGNAYIEDSGTTTFLGIFEFENDLSQNLLTKDLSPGAEAIVTNPLPLVEASAATPSDTPFVNDAFAVFNAGITVCSTGDCGDSLGTDARTGFYGQRTRAGNLGQLTFHTGQVTGPDDNGLLFRFATTPTSNSNLLPPGDEGSVRFTYGRGVETSDTSGAYLSDNVFGFAEEGVDFDNNVTSETADIALASTGLVGTAGLVSPADQPEFLRWGFWSARTDTAIAEREDLVHAGTFAAGTLPDINSFPDDGTAFFAGIAVGRDADPNFLTPNDVAGTFTLSYDFGASQGTFGMDIAGFDFDNGLARGLRGDPRQYTVTGSNEAGRLNADGAFVAAGQNPLAATIGSFQIRDNDNPGREIVGVYGGDQPPS